MANALYPAYKALLLAAGLNLTSLNLKVVLVDTTSVYTYSSAHDFRDDITSVVATSGNLASKTTTGGVFDSADPTFTAVSGVQSEALILFNDTGTASSSNLIAYYDTGITGMPVTPNGGDIAVAVNASGWFAL